MSAPRTHANDPEPQSALRRLRAEMADPRLWIVLAAIAVILGVAGPFGTYRALDTLDRFVYWALVVGLGYLAGSLSDILLRPRLGRAPTWLVVAVLGLATGLAITLMLTLAHWAMFGSEMLTARQLLVMGSQIVAVAIVIFAAMEFVQGPAGPEATATVPALLDRLPHGLRAPLVSISVQDHYVEVTTTAGREMLLMRLSDALREVPEETGLQIHRSHWVAHAAIAEVARRGDGAEVTLADGRRLPVARSRMADLRAAGLLARRGA